MPGEGGLRRRELDHEAVGGCRGGGGLYALDGLYVAEAEGPEVWRVEAADRSSGVRQGVGALVAEAGGVRGVAGAQAVEDDERCATPHISNAPADEYSGDGGAHQVG